MNHTQVFNSTAGELEGWLKWTRRQNDPVIRVSEWITIRNLGGLELNDSSPEDEQNVGEGVPGVLVEGVTARETEHGSEVVITVWAGGMMHDLIEDPDTPLSGRVVRESDSLNPSPELTLSSCPACHWTILPTAEQQEATDHAEVCFL